MNAFKKWWEDEKFKYPYRAPNEIDCGMGWNAALKWLYAKLDYSIEHKEIKDIIENELPNHQTNNSTKQN